MAKCHYTGPMEQTHAQVVAALGGPASLAEALGVENVNTVLYWTRPGRRIPAKFWHRISALTAGTATEITIDRLSELPPNPAPSSTEEA